MTVPIITEAQIAQFNADGYILVENLFDADEVDLIQRISKSDAHLSGQANERHDAQGTKTRLALRNDLSESDIYSAIVQSRRVIDTMERMLGGEVYHYHHKMTMKEPYVGGAWEWHQDYGYWYNNGCLFPYMASCYIAVDPATKENGCMQVIKGSHLMGRIEHGRAGDQTGADMERVEQALKRMELVYAEMTPGTGLFFHCNTLHRSDQNRSPNPRWGFICCYNAARNDPYKKHGHPNYSPTPKIEDDQVRVIGQRQWEMMQREPVAAG